MRYAIILTISIFLLASCDKDKFTTRPQLKYESASTKSLQRGEVVTFRLTFTDAEGDLEDSIYIEQFEKTCLNTRDSSLYPLPVFPTSKNQQGEILINFANGQHPFVRPLVTPQCGRNDTCVFKFVLKDEAQNKSDTVFSEPIVIFR